MTKLFRSKVSMLLLGVALLLAGSFFAVRSGKRALESYRAMQFAGEHDFDGGNLDVALVSGWMNIRYIAEAYAVPQSFIFDEVGLEMSRNNGEIPIGRLNQRFEFGVNDLEEPILSSLVADAIVSYRENPVVTGLTEGRVEGWMNVTYIANSTGIPVETFFDALGLSPTGYAYMPLPRLAEEANYEPGLDSLIETLNQTVESATGGNR